MIADSDLRNLDEHADWPAVVGAALSAGVTKADMAHGLSCSQSTVSRWAAGRTSPGPTARTAIKRRLVEMLST